MANGYKKTTNEDNYETMTAEEMLEEQRRLEEEALARALPLQSAEAEILQASPVAPGQYQFGSVMPTSQGFMYVGNAPYTPERGSPLAATREYESAISAQNLPRAQEAASGLIGMNLGGIAPPGTPKPEEFQGFPREVPMPMETPAEMQAAIMDRYQRAVSKGFPEQEAIQMSGYNVAPQMRYGRGLLGRQTTIDRNVQGRLLRTNLLTGEVTDVTPASIPQKKTGPSTADQSAYRAAKTDLDKANEKVDELRSNLEMGISVPQSSFDSLFQKASDAKEVIKRYREKYPGEISSASAETIVPGTAVSPSARITPPLMETRTAAPSKITSKAQFDALPKGAIYIGKDGKRYRKP